MADADAGMDLAAAAAAPGECNENAVGHPLETSQDLEGCTPAAELAHDDLHGDLQPGGCQSPDDDTPEAPADARTDEPGWERVTAETSCEICGKPDWCGRSRDGRFVICMRCDEGALKETANGGWLYRRLDAKPGTPRVRTVRVPSYTPERPDLMILARRFQGDVDTARLLELADSLGLSAVGLQRLGIGWAREYGAWSIPMWHANGNLLGIHLRRPDGSKLAVKGGRQGLYIPSALTSTGPLLLAEGPTDCAALLDLGSAAVGRPSCRGCVPLIVDLVVRRRPEAVVIVADGDAPGRDGAQDLASVLVAYNRHIKVIWPPGGIKDVRAWKQAGASPAEIDAAIATASPLTLTIKVEEVSRD